MSTRQITKLIHEGDYAAEVEVELVYDASEWSPYLSIHDAKKLDTVRKALQQGNVELALQHARIFKLIPVAA